RASAPTPTPTASRGYGRATVTTAYSTRGAPSGPTPVAIRVCRPGGRSEGITAVPTTVPDEPATAVPAALGADQTVNVTVLSGAKPSARTRTPSPGSTVAATPSGAATSATSPDCSCATVTLPS